MKALVTVVFFLLVAPAAHASSSGQDAETKCHASKIKALSDAVECRLKAERKSLPGVASKADLKKCSDKLNSRFRRAERSFDRAIGKLDSAEADKFEDGCTASADTAEWAELLTESLALRAKGQEFGAFPDPPMGRMCELEGVPGYSTCVDGSDDEALSERCKGFFQPLRACKWKDCIPSVQEIVSERWENKRSRDDQGNIALVNHLIALLKEKTRAELNPVTELGVQAIIRPRDREDDEGMRHIFTKHREDGASTEFPPTTGAMGFGTESVPFPLCDEIPENQGGESVVGNLIGTYASDTDTFRCALPYAWKPSVTMRTACSTMEGQFCNPVENATFFYNISSSQLHATGQKFIYGGCVKDFEIFNMEPRDEGDSHNRFVTKEPWHAKDWMVGCHDRWHEYVSHLRSLASEKVRDEMACTDEDEAQDGHDAVYWRSVLGEENWINFEDWLAAENVEPGWALYKQPNMQKYIMMYYKPFMAQDENYGGCAYSFNTLYEEFMAFKKEDSSAYTQLVDAETCPEPRPAGAASTRPAKCIVSPYEPHECPLTDTESF